MSQHPSLRSSDKSKQHRSVLKRFERLKHMKDKGKWEEGMSIFGMPKIKMLKFKIKKEKAAPEEVTAAAGAEGAVSTEAAEGAAVKEGAKKEEKGQAKAPVQDKKEPKGKK